MKIVDSKNNQISRKYLARTANVSNKQDNISLITVSRIGASRIDCIGKEEG